MEKNELQEKIYSKIDELPTLPAVLPRLLSLMEDEKTSAMHMADVISRDPALTSKIFKSCQLGLLRLFTGDIKPGKGHTLAWL